MKDSKEDRPIALSWLLSTITRVEVKEQVNQHTRDNRRINSDENSSEMNTSHGKKWRKNILKPNGNYFILMKSGNFGSLDHYPFVQSTTIGPSNHCSSYHPSTFSNSSGR
jgi:hypothetical protein